MIHEMQIGTPEGEGPCVGVSVRGLEVGVYVSSVGVLRKHVCVSV